MYVYRSTVTASDFAPLSAEVDPTAPGGGEHLNFDTILRRCGHAWMTMLRDLGGFGAAVIVPRLEVDYHREVGVGELLIEISIASIGRTSFRIAQDVRQGGQLAARAEVVLVVFDYESGKPVQLTDEQRNALATV